MPAWLRHSTSIGRTPKLETQQDLVKRVATAGSEEPLLAKETAIFSALMYKNNSQHRRTLSFQHLRQVYQTPGQSPVHRWAKFVLSVLAALASSKYLWLLIGVKYQVRFGRVTIPCAGQGIKAWTHERSPDSEYVPSPVCWPVR